ncbi:hypothetical protein [Akkermansia sp.]|uniref:hypothetical protein n=1 Tax=Akkermansia sp. TaxID=1872421 RepID=UPI0025C19D50|nr:hypothetical protein [Akkermansia sp.]MCC8149096.1 hypothetical protein [Akkermansia sp.]
MSESQIEHLQHRVRQQLPAVLDEWLGKARAELEKLTRAAADETVSDEDFVHLLEDFASDPLRLVKLMNPSALASALEDAMGTAMAVGKIDIERQYKKTT